MFSHLNSNHDQTKQFIVPTSLHRDSRQQFNILRVTSPVLSIVNRKKIVICSNSAMQHCYSNAI
jgi:hypothetical protein